MNNIAEIEDAIEKLPAPELAKLVGWLDAFRLRREAAVSVDKWLNNARGAARPGETTANIMTHTRGEE